MHNSNNSALSKDRIFGASNHININSVFSSTSNLEDISVARAKEALSKKLVALKEAIQLSNKPINTAQTNNITETPKFHEAKIGERARNKSLNEQIEEARAHFKQTFTKQQTRRARKYNIPFDASIVDYHQLSRKIDEYEFLLDEAKRWDISWDIKIYDPVALEQELEEARSRYWSETRSMRSDYYSSVRV